MESNIIELLRKSKSIAVVGASPNKRRPSNYISEYLMGHYSVIPVNPGHDTLFGNVCYPNISAIPDAVDIINIFRRSSDVLPIVEEAIARGNVKLIWMQDNVINKKARDLAIKNNIPVVMNDCIYRVHRSIF